MDTCIVLLVLALLPQLVMCNVPMVTSFRAIVELVSDNSRIFTGESLHLRCSIPDIHGSNWSVEWFRGSEKLPETGENFKLWNAKIKASGKFSCQGARKTMIGIIRTLQSVPVEIEVDGGWAILKPPSRSTLVGDTLKLSCRLRGFPPIHETILYKDGIEVMRQIGQNVSFYLSNVTLGDSGMYSCRVSWDVRRRTYSVTSVNTPVHILEVLSQPLLEIHADIKLYGAKKMKLICHVLYNARAPAPPVHYYFYKNNEQLGMAKSKNYDLVTKALGQYSCRVKVPQLDLVRRSKPSSFGDLPE
ncbi:low affinity immunoglobulin gamma Fc region receptor IV [Oryzias latipes]|uniref:Ig-like domain-containing protein n=3 Tax=Oryzias latipes TaxID=8090 RepID=A0A3B3H5F9_ORYLA|nr:low affinity immunoglobulin gamma Fc region receptor IV [Oryzias latipes]